MLYRESFI